MSKKIKSMKVVELEDRLYDLASVLRRVKSMSEPSEVELSNTLSKAKRELEDLGWSCPDEFEKEFESDLRPEDYIGMI